MKCSVDASVLQTNLLALDSGVMDLIQGLYSVPDELQCIAHSLSQYDIICLYDANP